VAQDESHARDQLVAMMELIARGPHEALGLASQASASEVRAAFLQLSKTYHPARFARMPTDIQKLSNEVFLALRGAHDTLARSAKATALKTGPIPILQRTSGSGTMPALQPPGTSATRSSSQMPVHNPQQPEPSPQPRATGQVPAARTSEYPVVSPRTKTSDIERPARVASPSPPPPTPSAQRPPARPGPPLRPDVELAAALELLARGQWDAARSKLDALAAHAPESPRYRALLAYARGREAQLSQRPDEARIELMTALQIDPDLQLAKTALGELFARRK
jgi:hypothetical protein